MTTTLALAYLCGLIIALLIFWSFNNDTTDNDNE